MRFPRPTPPLPSGSHRNGSDLPLSVALRWVPDRRNSVTSAHRREVLTISLILVAESSEVLRPTLHRLLPNLVPVLVKNNLFVVCCRNPSPLPEFAFELT
jgi:hypothetical protein